MEGYDKAKYLKSFKYGFITAIKIILSALWWDMAPYASFLNTEGVGFEPTVPLQTR